MKNWFEPRRFALCGCLLAAGLGAHTGAHAAAKFGEEIVSLKLGVFLSDFDSRVGFTGPAGGTVGIDLEDQLGMDSDQTTFRGEAMWRFLPRHRVIIGYYKFDRDARRTLQSDVVLNLPSGDTYEFAANATVSSEFEWRLIPVSYAYSFYKSDDVEVAATVGIHWFDMELSMAGEVSINGAPPVVAGADTGAASGPLPVIGLRADYAITPKWLVGGHLQWFGLDYDDYSGDLKDARLQTEYWLTDSFGVGLGYTWYDINVTKTRTNITGKYKGRANQTYDGFEAYIGARF